MARRARGVRFWPGVPREGDVVGCGIGPGVARTQYHGEGLPGALAAAIGERQDRVEAKRALECGRSRLLLGVGDHDRGVQVDDQRLTRIAP